MKQVRDTTCITAMVMKRTIDNRESKSKDQKVIKRRKDGMVRSR